MVLAVFVGIAIEDNGGSFWRNVLGSLVRWVLTFVILSGFLFFFGFARELERRRAMKLKTKPQAAPMDASNEDSKPNTDDRAKRR